MENFKNYVVEGFFKKLFEQGFSIVLLFFVTFYFAYKNREIEKEMKRQNLKLETQLADLQAKFFTYLYADRDTMISALNSNTKVLDDVKSTLKNVEKKIHSTAAAHY